MPTQRCEIIYVHTNYESARCFHKIILITLLILGSLLLCVSYTKFAWNSLLHCHLGGRGRGATPPLPPFRQRYQNAISICFLSLLTRLFQKKSAFYCNWFNLRCDLQIFAVFCKHASAKWINIAGKPIFRRATHNCIKRKRKISRLWKNNIFDENLEKLKKSKMCKIFIRWRKVKGWSKKNFFSTISFFRLCPPNKLPRIYIAKISLFLAHPNPPSWLRQDFSNQSGKTSEEKKKRLMMK